MEGSKALSFLRFDPEVFCGLVLLPCLHMKIKDQTKLVEAFLRNAVFGYKLMDLG